jgi:hypothetical protein
MIIFLKKGSSYEDIWSNIAEKIENFRPVFRIYAGDNLSSYKDESLLLDHESFMENKIDFSDFREVYILFSENVEPSLEKDFVDLVKPSGIYYWQKTYLPELLSQKAHEIRKTHDEIKSLQTQMIEFSGSLNITLDSFEGELKKIKRIYNKVVPFRSSNFKGVDFRSKFYSGESTGGEFFDVHECENKLILGASSCNSYLISTSYMTLFTDLKQSSKFSEELIDQFLKDTQAEFNSLEEASGRDLNFDQFLLVLDLSSLDYTVHNFGNFSFIGKDHFVVPPGQSSKEKVFQGQLKRGEKFILSSPGLANNWQYYREETLVHEFVQENFNLAPSELIDEVSIVLKKHEESDFLKYDSSIICIEVGQNVIHSV